jgi:hypothetical protein
MAGFNRAIAPVGQAAPWRGGTDWPAGQTGAAQVAGNISGLLNSNATPGQVTWHPTIIYLMVFVVAEMLVFHFLSNHLGL